MKVRTPAILIGTHLLALGAGWWSVGNRGPEFAADPGPAPAAKAERLPRPERRVSTADLLAAYRNSELWGEALKRRNEASRPRDEPPHGTPAVHVPAEQRAAEIADVAGAMEKELEAVRAGKAYDHQLAKALVARWMKEDPAACAAWLGQMTMRGGWGDPFDAFAKTLPPGELLALMEQGWLQTNRRLALDYLARHLGATAAAELSAVLPLLREGEAEAFLGNAVVEARMEDAAAWLTVLDGDPRGLKALADRWIGGPGSSWTWSDGEWVPSDRSLANWQESAEELLAAAAGTPAEAIFRERLESERHRSEIGRELVRVTREPAEASAALVDLYRDQGHDEAEARRLAAHQISQSYQGGLEVWQREAWEQDLQLSLLDRRKLEDVLAARLEAIKTELPEVLQVGTRNLTWRDAMIIDPSAAFDVARQQGRIEEARQNAIAMVGSHEISRNLQAEVLLALAEQGLWEQGGQLPSAGPFIADYLREDPEAARRWMARLPLPLSRSMKEESK